MKRLFTNNPVLSAGSVKRTSLRCDALTPNQISTVYDIAAIYDARKGKGDVWTERTNEAQDIANALGISFEEANDIMTEMLGFEDTLNLTPEEESKVLDIAELYNVSNPDIDDWEMEVAHEKRKIASELNCSLEKARYIMIDVLGFDPDAIK